MSIHTLAAGVAAPPWPVRPLPITPDVYSFHYACEFFDECGERSPRVFAVAFEQVGFGHEHVTFSAVKHAERLRIPFTELLDRFDELEALMLDECGLWLARRPGICLVHFGMKREHYGPPALAHRAELHWPGKAFPVPPASRRWDIDRFLLDNTGEEYHSWHPRMTRVAERNGGLPRQWLDTETEVREARGRCEFWKDFYNISSRTAFVAHLHRRMWGDGVKTPEGDIRYPRGTEKAEEQYRPAEAWGDLLGYAATKLKGKQRALVEKAAADHGVPIPKLALALEWDGGGIDNAYNSLAQAVNRKLKKAGLPYRIRREDGTALVREISFGTQVDDWRPPPKG